MLELLRDQFAVGVGFAFGLLLGSFANVLAYRLPRGVSVVLPGSFCTECGHAVRPIDNVPVLSFLWLGARCRDCHSPIGWRHPTVELISGLAAAAVVYRFGLTAEAAALVLLFTMLLALFITDLDFHILPDELTILGTVIGLLLAGAAHLNLLTRTQGPETFPEAALGAVGGAGLLLLVMTLYRLVRDREGMGVGDVKMVALIGAFLGLEPTLATFMLAVLLGTVGGLLFVAVRGGGLQTALPFGTYLAVATPVVVFYYPWFAAHYLIR